MYGRTGECGRGLNPCPIPRFPHVDHWVALIFDLSSQPSAPGPLLFNGLDKLVPVLFYGIPGFFLACSLVPPEVTSWKWMFLITILVTAYGMMDEYHPLLVSGRGASAGDVLADGAGGSVTAGSRYWRHHRIAKSA